MFLYVGGMPGDGIGIWSLSDDGLSATSVATVGGLHSPSFLCAHPQLPLLYAAERRWSAEDGSTGAVSIFEIDPAGGLMLLARIPSGGAFTAHVSVSGDGKFLAVANPRGPNIALWALDAAGLPIAEPQVIAHEGRGATPRQAEPWPHSTFFTPDGRHMLACDLALDRVFIHDLAGAGALSVPSAQAMVQVSSGAGARHLALSADGRHFYVANELDSTVSVFGFDEAGDCFAIVQTLPATGADFAGANQPAEILLTPGGEFLLLTNRGADTVARFRVDAASGRLTPCAPIACGGETPRHIALDRNGRLAAVCNQKSNAVSLFQLDRDGEMRLLPDPVPFPNPTCALFWAAREG